MTLKQLRYLREIARHSLNISAAATTLHTSQPGLSRQIQMLEAELGLDLLVRQKNRIVALTKAGEAVLSAGQRLLNEAENIELLAQDARGNGAGRLVLATSHLHARYTLLHPFKALQKKHPDVQLLMFQADPDQIPKLVRDGEADIGISTTDEEARQHTGTICLDGSIVRRSAIMVPDHPLARKKRLTLADFAAYPFVGYNPQSRAGRLIARAFEESGTALRSVVQANDSDVIKAYVAEGLGVGIVPATTLDRGADEGLHSVDVTSLLPRASTSISIRRDMYLRRYVTDFIHMVAPSWTRSAILRVTERVPERAGTTRDGFVT